GDAATVDRQRLGVRHQRVRGGADRRHPRPRRLRRHAGCAAAHGRDGLRRDPAGRRVRGRQDPVRGQRLGLDPHSHPPDHRGHHRLPDRRRRRDARPGGGGQLVRDHGAAVPPGQGRPAPRGEHLTGAGHQHRHQLGRGRRGGRDDLAGVAAAVGGGVAGADPARARPRVGRLPVVPHPPRAGPPSSAPLDL
ncbi:MAG: hypothetical protein AVDCRST_MAG41-388, partial [uncultured Corynebacteriales bacterium]